MAAVASPRVDTFTLAGVTLLVREMQRGVRGDSGFVAARWGSSYVSRARCDRRVYARGQYKLIDRLMTRSRVVVVCSLASPSTLHAFAVGEPGALHYAYVVPELRGNGLARRCIEAVLGEYPDEIRCSHVWPERRTRFLFDPYTLEPTP